MTREVYHRELRRLENDLQTLGNMAQEAIRQAVRQLEDQGDDEARELIAYDEAINARRYQIEGDVLTLIATQAPVARDMRELAAMLEIAGELERIGDYAKGIANIKLMLGGVAIDARVLRLLGQMAEEDCSMLTRALDAFEQRDDKLAAEVIAADDIVDDLFNEVFRLVVSGESLPDDADEPTLIELANYLLWMAHNLERTADRVTNIGERVIYTVTGELTELIDSN